MRISDWSSDVCSSDLPHRIEPVADANLRIAALLVENDLPFGQVEIERRARGARFCQQRPARPQIPERREHIGIPLLTRCIGVVSRLRMFISDVRAQPDKCPRETP